MTDQLGCLIIDLQGQEVSVEEREILQHPLVGGVILFSKNYASRQQLSALCSNIRALRQHTLILVDQEGGRVQRFIHEFTRIPRMGTLGKMYMDDAKAAYQLTQDCGWLLASELLATGVDLSLTPVLDLNKNQNTVIGDRAFHHTPQVVSDLAYALMQGMREAGMVALGKHFPGHGAVTADSHLQLPSDNRSWQDIAADDLLPFLALMQQQIPAIMAAHIVFPQVDTLPVSFSSIWLRDILRERLQFKGIIMSDDLNMAGANIAKNYVDRVLAARIAGCDFTLLCNQRAGVIEVLDRLPEPSAHYINKEKWGILQGDFSQQQALPYAQTQRFQQTREALNTVMQKWQSS